MLLRKQEKNRLGTLLKMVILKKEFSYFDICKVIRLFFYRYSKIRLLCYVINKVTLLRNFIQNLKRVPIY